MKKGLFLIATNLLLFFMVCFFLYYNLRANPFSAVSFPNAQTPNAALYSTQTLFFPDQEQYFNIQGFENLTPALQSQLIAQLSKKIVFLHSGQNKMVALIKLEQDDFPIYGVIVCLSHHEISRDSRLFFHANKLEIQRYLIELTKGAITGIITQRENPFPLMNLSYTDIGAFGAWEFGNRHSDRKLIILPQYHHYFPLQYSQYMFIKQLLNNINKQVDDPDSEISIQECILMIEGLTGELGMEHLEKESEVIASPDNPHFKLLQFLRDNISLHTDSNSQTMARVAFGMMANRKMNFAELLYFSYKDQLKIIGVDDADLYCQGYRYIYYKDNTIDFEAVNRLRTVSFMENAISTMQKYESKVGILSVGAGHVFSYDENRINTDFAFQDEVLYQFYQNKQDFHFIVLLPHGFLGAYPDRNLAPIHFHRFEQHIMDIIQSRIIEEMEADILTNIDSLFQNRPNPMFYYPEGYRIEGLLNTEIRKFACRFLWKLYTQMEEQVNSNVYITPFHLEYVPLVNYQLGLTEDEEKNFIFAAYRNQMWKTVMDTINSLGEEIIYETGQFTETHQFIILRHTQQIEDWIRNYLTNYNRQDPRNTRQFDLASPNLTHHMVSVNINFDDLYLNTGELFLSLKNQLKSQHRHSVRELTRFFNPLLNTPLVDVINLDRIIGKPHWVDGFLNLPLDTKPTMIDKIANFLPIMNLRLSTKATLFNEQYLITYSGYGGVTLLYTEEEDIFFVEQTPQTILPLINPGMESFTTLLKSKKMVDIILRENIRIYLD